MLFRSGEIQLRFISELTRFCDLESVSPFHSDTSTGELVTQTFSSKLNDEPVPALDSGFDDSARVFDTKADLSNGAPF